MIDVSRTSHNALHSFCIRPKVTFDNQDPDEEIILVLRAHPITQLPWIINSAILFTLLVLFNFSFLTTYITSAQLLYINIFIFIMILSYMFFNFLSYFFNVGIVTNKRVLDFDYYVIIYKEFTEAKLARVEDITAKSGGYFASLFNFGDVFIQTAGTEANIEFLKVARPQDVVDIINGLTP